MIGRFASWLNDVNTTSFRIVVSVLGAVLNITVIQVAILRGWEPSAMQVKVLTGEAAVLLTMMGFDVIQFIGKRFSDAGYAAAKQPPPSVTVEAPSVVKVDAAGGIAPTADSSPALATASATAVPPAASPAPIPGARDD